MAPTPPPHLQEHGTFALGGDVRAYLIHNLDTQNCEIEATSLDVDTRRKLATFLKKRVEEDMARIHFADKDGLERASRFHFFELTVPDTLFDPIELHLRVRMPDNVSSRPEEDPTFVIPLLQKQLGIAEEYIRQKVCTLDALLDEGIKRPALPLLPEKSPTVAETSANGRRRRDRSEY